MSPYPSTRTLKITIDGTDRTLIIPISRKDAVEFGARPVTIEDILTRVANRASFTVLDADDISLAGLQDVIISSTDDTTRYFAGLITRLTDRSRGDGLDMDVDCQDYGWYLDHPEVLIDAEYTSQSDQAIIQDFMPTCCPDLDHDTYVDQVLATIDYIRFENETPRRALERLAALAGADFYVDDGPGAGGTKAALRYFASGTFAAPHSLSDTPDYSTSFPYSNFQKRDQVPDVNSVEVVGRHASEVRYYATNQDTNQGALSYSGGDTEFNDAGQDFAAWMEQGDIAKYRIIVTNSDGTESWGFLGGCNIADTEQGNLSYTTESGEDTFTDDGQDFTPHVNSTRIYVLNSDDTITWGYLGNKVSNTEVYIWQDAGETVRGWNGVDPSGKTPSSYNIVNEAARTLISVYQELSLSTGGFNGDDPSGKTPSSYVIWLAEGDYGYWIRHKLIDNDLVTTDQLRQRGDQYLSDVANGVSYTCSTSEPGLRSGQDVTVVNAARSLNSSLLVKRVTTTFDSGGYASFDVELGAHIPRFADVLAGGRNIWDEEKFLPKRPGLIEQEDAGTDVQVSHYLDTYNDQVGYPPMQVMRKSHSDTLGTKTPTVDTEELGYWPVYGVESGGDWQLAGYQKLVQDGAAGAGSIAAHWEIDPAIENANGDPYVVGPASSTDNAIARWDGTGGDTLQGSGLVLDDTEHIVGGDGNPANSPYLQIASNYVQTYVRDAGVFKSYITQDANVTVYATVDVVVGAADDVTVYAADDVIVGAADLITLTSEEGTQILQTAAAGALPVLTLDQADVDEPFIKFIGDAAAGDLTRDLVDYGDEASSTGVVWIKVEVLDDGNQVTDQDVFLLGYTLSA